MEKEMTCHQLEEARPLWLNVLPEIVNTYNNTFHHSIGMTPNEASTNDNWKRIKHRRVKPSKPKFAIGNKVRIQKYKPLFSKGYKQNWSNEVFTVFEAHSSTPPTYKLKDNNGEVIDGIFYDDELQITYFTNK